MSAPRHLAVIPDGNRRWASARGLLPIDGHRAGIANVGPIAEAAWSRRVSVFSFWWGSPANLVRRDPAEVAGIVGVLADWLTTEAPALLRRHGARFEVYGRWEALCPRIGPGVAAARAASSTEPGAPRLALLMAYDGREELAAAAATGPADAAALEAALWTADLGPVDLVLRTAGEPHLSAGFLLWHIAEAQLAFVDPPWPAFTSEELAAVLDRYASTARRFGG